MQTNMDKSLEQSQAKIITPTHRIDNSSEQQPEAQQPKDPNTEIFASFDDMSSPAPTDLPPSRPLIIEETPDAIDTVDVETPSILSPFPQPPTRQEPSVLTADLTREWEKLKQENSFQLEKKERPTNLKSRHGESSSSSSSEDSSDAEPPMKKASWGHNSEPNPLNKGLSATQKQNPLQLPIPTEKSRFQPGSESGSESSSESESESDNVSELSPLQRLAKHVASLKNQEKEKDLFDKANSLYIALSALANEQADPDLNSYIESDEEELCVDNYVAMANSILECDPASPEYANHIDNFNVAAQKAKGSPSRGWQIVGALMMVLGAALVVVGSLALAGTLGLAAPVAGAMIGGGVFAMASGLTFFSINRKRGLSNAMSEFAKSADNLTVEEEELSDNYKI